MKVATLPAGSEAEIELHQNELDPNSRWLVVKDGMYGDLKIETQVLSEPTRRLLADFLRG